MGGAGSRQFETMKHRFVWVTALGLFGCGGSALDVGSNQGGSPGSGTGGSESGASASTGGAEATAGNSFGGAMARGGASAAGGELSMGAQSATGGRGSSATGGTPAVGGRPTKGEGGSATSSGGSGAGASGGATGASGSKGTAMDPPPDQVVPQACGEMFHQVWEGSTLDFFFNPQDDKWRLEFNGTDANGRLCGTATYIAAGQAAPPPATDPDVVYPPSFDPMSMQAKMISEPFPGVTYSIIQGADVSGVFHFRISPNELWKDWCALQTPVPQGDGYGCVGGNGGWASDGTNCTITNSDGTTQQYPYGKCALCASPGVCTCNAKYCVAADRNGSVVFDLKIDGAQLRGTVGGTMISFDRVD